MSALTIAAVALAAGWVFVRRWLQTRFIALREVGHPQYFSAGVAAVCLLTLGACVHHFTKQNLTSYSQIEAKFIDLLPKGDEVKPAANAEAKDAAKENAAHLADFAEIAGWALLLAWVLPWFFNLPVFHSPRLMKALMKKVGAYDAIEQIYAHSLDCGVPLAITLKNGKVYIGYSVATSPLPDVERKWLTLFPLLSGYRDDKSKLELPTNYAQTYGEINEKTPQEALELINQFRVVLSFGEIVSIQAFNVDFYYQWFVKQSAETAQDPDGKPATELRRTVDDWGDQPLAEPTKQNDSSAAETPPESDAAADLNPVDANPDVLTLSLKPAAPLTDDEAQRLRLYRGYYLSTAMAIVLIGCLPSATWGALLVALLCAWASGRKSQPD